MDNIIHSIFYVITHNIDDPSYFSYFSFYSSLYDRHYNNIDVITYFKHKCRLFVVLA